MNGRAEIQVFTGPLGGEEDAAKRLADFEIIVGMRERPPFKLPLPFREKMEGRGKQKSPLFSRPDSGVRVVNDGIRPKSKKVKTFLDFALRVSYA